MIPVTTAWTNYMQNSRVFNIECEVDGDTWENDSFMEGSVTFEDAVSSGNEFTLGSVITNCFKATLNNFDDRFDITQLEGKVITVSLGVDDLPSIQKGVYTIARPLLLGSTIQITAYDYMDKFNTYINEYSFGGKTCYQVVSNFCTTIGVTLAGHFPNDTYILSEIELSNTSTYRQILSYIAQLCGCVARIDRFGQLELKRLKAITTVTEDDNAVVGTAIVGQAVVGTDNTPVDNYQITALQSLSVNMSDVAIGAITVRANNTNEKIETTIGSNGLGMTLSGNPFVTTKAQCDNVCNQLFAMYGNMTFRPFECTAFGDPTIEAGDPISIVLKGVTYNSIVTSISYNLNGTESFTCGWDDYEEMVSENDVLTKFAVDQAYKVLQLNGLVADWIRGGTLKIGGSGFTSEGKIEVYNSEDNLIASIDKNGVNINQGNFVVNAEDEDEYKIRVQLQDQVADLEYSTNISPTNFKINEISLGDESSYFANYSARGTYLNAGGGDLESPLTSRLSAETLAFLIGNAETFRLTADFLAFKLNNVETLRLNKNGSATFGSVNIGQITGNSAKIDSINGSARKNMPANGSATIALQNSAYCQCLLSICGANNAQGKGLYLISAVGSGNAIITNIVSMASAISVTSSRNVVTVNSTSTASYEVSVIPLSSEYSNITLL